MYTQKHEMALTPQHKEEQRQTKTDAQKAIVVYYC